MNAKSMLTSRILARLLLVAALLLAGAAAAGGFERGLLWKIEAPGIPPSYLFGTMHSEDPAVVRLPGPVQRAFDSADAVTLEVVMDPAALLSMTSAFMFADGSTLEARIGKPLYRRAVAALAAYGIPEPMVSGMKPWAAAVTLMTPPSGSGMVLDLLLYQQALGAGKPVDGLETPMEQVSVFDDMPEKDQVLMLKDALDNLDGIKRMLEQLKAAYLARDLARLTAISDASMATLHDSDPDSAQRFNDRLITERNHRMAERLHTRLQQGRRFIAVGALHLPGDEGLLALLSRQGYRVTAVY